MRPSQVSAPLSINQANLSAPLSSERAPFYQSGKLERPIQKGRSSSYPSSVSQELRMDEGMTKADPIVETERGLTHFSSVCLLPI